MSIASRADVLPWTPPDAGEAQAAARTARAGQGHAASKQRRAEEAAKTFEGLLVKQMFRAMRRTLPEGSPMREGSGPGGHLYMQFIDDALSDHLTSGPGIGLRDTLIRAMGGDPDLVRSTPSVPIRTHRAAPPAHAAELEPGHLEVSTEVGARLPGATGLLQSGVEKLMHDGGARRFAKHGQLSERDLASSFRTENDDGVATFNAEAADGYRGHPKCNLFALEAARRAGYAVPLVARDRGWGFPGTDRLTHDAADGELRGNWAQVATGASATELDREITNGRGAFLLVGSADGERHGHMAVVERVHGIDYGPDGEVRRIVFDGYEARTRGAMRLERRTWNIEGNAGGRGARNGFSGIELLRLRRAVARPEVPLSASAPSTRDSDFASSANRGRPIHELEEK